MKVQWQVNGTSNNDFILPDYDDGAWYQITTTGTQATILSLVVMVLTNLSLSRMLLSIP